MARITAYTLAIPRLPKPTLLNRIFRRKLLRKTGELIKSLDGLQGITFAPSATLLHFYELNQAIIARNRIEATGNKCGERIMECELDEETGTANMMKPAE